MSLMASSPPLRTRVGVFRAVLQKSLWAEIWRSVRRAHKDSRARRQLYGLAALLLLLVAAIAYLALLIGSGAWFFLPFVIAVMWWRHRSASRDLAPLNIAPIPEPLEKPITAEEQQAVRRYFAELALLYAVLVDRAGSERFLKEKTLPEDIEITSRRIHLALLRKYALWDRMASADRDAVMMPDGHWDLERIHRVTTGIEPLRLLRWILRLDFRLPSIGQQLHGDFSIAHEIVHDPELVFSGHELADADTIREGCDDANYYRIRCYAESVSRGYQAAENERTAEWAKTLSAQLKGKQDEDLLLDDELVSEVDRDKLSWATALAVIRAQFLANALNVVESGQPPPPPIASMYCA
jgi:hypothetical protein